MPTWPIGLRIAMKSVTAGTPGRLNRRADNSSPGPGTRAGAEVRHLQASMRSTPSFPWLRLKPGFGLALPALLLLLAFFVLPVVALLSRSVTEPELGLHHYQTLLASGT